jgi:hypothetical protein
MRHSFAALVIACCAAIFIAVSSYGSAAMMAPDRDEIALDQITLLFGADQGDFCGDAAGEKLHCPFCRLLGDPPSMTPVDRSMILQPHDGWRRLAELLREAQARDLNHAPRAPPVQA